MATFKRCDKCGKNDLDDGVIIDECCLFEGYGGDGETPIWRADLCQDCQLDTDPNKHRE